MEFKKYHESLEQLHVNCEENRSYYITEKNGLSCNSMEKSSRVTMLSSDDWKFKIYPSPFAVEDFIDENFNSEKFDEITVPSNWQILGYDKHNYINVGYSIPYDPPYVPDENLSGAYIKYFDINDSQISMKNYLNFEGVDSCFYVWLNGQFVGYSQVSHCTSEFDISSQLKVGTNKLCVLVLKWCVGTYLEDQDKLRMSGIFRDVYIVSRPHNHIQDFYVKTDLSADYKDATVTLKTWWAGEKVDATITLQDPSGVIVASKALTDNFSIFVPNALLWNAEQPYLYKLILETKDERIEQDVGIRKFEIAERKFLLNGVAIKFKGVNRHDSDPVTGYVISKEQLTQDLKLMKEHNFNAVRTSHYPNAPWAAMLYDKYGFYIVSESDIEMHGTIAVVEGGNVCDYTTEFTKDFTFGALMHDPRFEKAVLDRVQRNVIRDKNHACVALWSLGNEAGYGPNAENAAKWIKMFDKELLVHYENSVYQMENYSNDTSNIDVYSRMYAPTEAIDIYKDAEWSTKPCIQCEFVHAMGNGPGDIEDNFKQIYEYDFYAGAFVWEWCDHAINMGKTASGKDKYYYGGDWGEFPNHGNFCMDGLVYPNRKPHTGLLEYKNVARPVRAALVDLQKAEILLENKLDFVNIKDVLFIDYEISENGKVVETGALGNVDIPAKQSLVCRIPNDFNYSGNVYLKLNYYNTIQNSLVPYGMQMGFDQIEIKKATAEKPMLQLGLSDVLEITENEKYFTIKTEKFKYVYNRFSATFDSMCFDNQSVIEKPMEYNIWRAPTDNDVSIKMEWMRAGYNRHTVKVYRSKIERSEQCVTIKTAFSISAKFIQRILEVDATYEIYGNGQVHVQMRCKKDKVMPFLPRFGLRLFLKDNFNAVNYIGYGPYESYLDKHRSSYYGQFVSDVMDMHEDYIKPQENGSHYNCDELRLKNENGFGIFVGADKFSFNVSKYTQEELTDKKHNFELQESGYTVVCLDAKMSGIGSGSCGPQLKEEYQFNENEFVAEFNFMFG